MLGSLSKWLRIFGFDSAYADNTKSDEILLERATEEKRILVTRDRALTGRARKKNVESVLIESMDIDEQIVQFFDALDLKIDGDPAVVRCPVCNGVLDKVSKEEIQEKVPSSVINAFDEFWRCVSCEKIYWKGTHWSTILDRIRRLKNEKDV
jgi:hypothetical protein